MQTFSDIKADHSITFNEAPPPKKGGTNWRETIQKVTYILDFDDQPTNSNQLNQKDLAAIQAELDDLRTFKKNTHEKEAREEEVKVAKRAKEAERSRT